MHFKPYYLGCLAHASYLIAGDDGEAAVIDPRRDVEEYLEDARSAGLTIRHVIETHLHADFVSGHEELARRAGGATIYLGEGSGATYPHRAVKDNETLSLGGGLTLTFLRTPGHTPEGVSVLARAPGEPDRLFSGDTLFIGDVGRPDLVGSKGHTPEAMARMLFASLRDKILTLPDATEVWPAHGAGSACGKALSDERVSTIGRQKIENLALRHVVAGDEEAFVRYTTEGLSSAPAYFGHDARKNREGVRSVAEVLEAARPLAPAVVEEASEEGVLVLDVRPAEDFGAGHVPGAVNIPLQGKFAPWVGAVLPVDAPLIVVADGAERVNEAMTRLVRVGYENIVGWLEGSMDAWRAAGGEVVLVPQWSPEELERRRHAADGALRVLDVRTTDEWEAGHVDGAHHLPLADLAARLWKGEGVVAAALPTPGDAPLAVMCGSGYRSTIAASLLQRAGRRNVANAVGGWEAWRAAARPAAAAVSSG
jgi:Zn-dependent hydrolases, including glyoxylases